MVGAFDDILEFRLVDGENQRRDAIVLHPLRPSVRCKGLTSRKSSKHAGDDQDAQYSLDSNFFIPHFDSPFFLCSVSSFTITFAGSVSP